MNALQWAQAFYAPIHEQAKISDPIDVVPLIQGLARVVAAIAKVSDQEERLLAIFSESLELCMNVKKVTIQ